MQTRQDNINTVRLLAKDLGDLQRDAWELEKERVETRRRCVLLIAKADAMNQEIRTMLQILQQNGLVLSQTLEGLRTA